MYLTADVVRRLAARCGFELAGVAKAVPLPEALFFQKWSSSGMAAEMSYLTGDRAALRQNPRTLLPSARSIICVGKVYNHEHLFPGLSVGREFGRISRYAAGADYHLLIRERLNHMVKQLRATTKEPFQYKICVDTAPLLERVYAQRAGLGWQGKNTCLINERFGSWFFLGEIITSLDIQSDEPITDRCGACTMCIDACPTKAIVPVASSTDVRWQVDARLCISYLTIESTKALPEPLRPLISNSIFGCDICQEVCPWNSKAAPTSEQAFYPKFRFLRLEELAVLSREQFRTLFQGSPIRRAGYDGLLRNVAVAMGNSGLPRFRIPLEKLASTAGSAVANHARWALKRLK
jgi:epoxyqueuosine reductase